MAKADIPYRPERHHYFGRAVKQLLEENDLSQYEFAKRAGLTKDYVWKLVNGEITEPRKATVEKIAQGLGISVDELWQRVKQQGTTAPTQPEGPLPPIPECPQSPDPVVPDNTPDTAEKWVVGLDVLRTVPVWEGRDALLKQLCQGFVGVPGEAIPRPGVLALVGQGGIGKTSLAVKLLEAVGVDLRRAALAPQSVYAGVICFRAEEGSSFDEVASVLLSALGVEVAESLKEAEQKIQQMIRGLQRRRYLLLLDNLEVILHPASHPEAGRAIQPEWGQLLNALVYRPHQSQVMLTSREVPLDLADRRYPNSEPDPLLVCIERLGGVDVAAGAEILSQRQVQDPQADREWVAEKVEGHVFVLTQLAAVAKGRPGYLRQHPELVTQRAEPILQEQLARQSEPARELLKRMCVLRVGIDVRGLTFLRLYRDVSDLGSLDSENDFRWWMAVELEEPAELTEAEIEETQALVNRLVDSCLVQCRYDEHRREDVYDLHRLIVEFLQAEYQAELPDLLKRVYSFYRTGKSVNKPTTLEDLRPVLEAQHFAFQLGNYSEAASLVMHQIEKYLAPWGYWSLLQDLYVQILPKVDEEDSPYWLQRIGSRYRDFGNWDEAEKYYRQALAVAEKYQIKSLIAGTQGQLGDIKRNRGNWDAAERLFRQCLQIEEDLGDRAGMASSWASLGDIERNRGHWDAAERLFRQSLQLREDLGDRAGMASSWGGLGDIERNRGNWDAAECLYRQALQLMEDLGDRAGMATSWGCLGYIEFCRGNWDAAERLFRQSLQLREDLGDRAGMATSWGCLGDIERLRGNYDAAEQLKRKSFELRQELNDRPGMAMSLGAWGDIERNRGNWDAAERLYRKSMELSQELGYTWQLAHSHYDLAQLERQRCNSQQAEDYYTIAHQLFTQLGAAKDLEKIEQEWQANSPSHPPQP